MHEYLTHRIADVYFHYVTVMVVVTSVMTGCTKKSIRYKQNIAKHLEACR